MAPEPSEPGLAPAAPARRFRLLAYCDSPTCGTGFGTAARNILLPLHATGLFDIDIIGVNYLGEPHELPFRIWPAGINPEQDIFGRRHAARMIRERELDLLFLFQDAFILDFVPALLEALRRERRRPFRSIGYFPVDSTLKPAWAANLAPIDHLVAYTELGRDAALRQLPARTDIRVIPHGVNPTDFHPIADRARVADFRRDWLGAGPGRFVVTNVNRNQVRKDIPRTLLAFRQFREQVPGALLYLHMARQDIGWDLPEVCAELGLRIPDDVCFPPGANLDTFNGHPREVLNLVYNASDVIVSTSLGEGFGLTWAEAMAAGVPVIMPRHTAMAEFITDDTGYLVDAGSNANLWTVLKNDFGVARPLTDVDDLVRTLLRVHAHPDEAMARAGRAYRWVTEHLDWRKDLHRRWLAVFAEAAASLAQETDAAGTSEAAGADSTIPSVRV
jgi:glycosyltransferase involved in cell wall biosynthesis